jgi:hypothetical protein
MFFQIGQIVTVTHMAVIENIVLNTKRNSKAMKQFKLPQCPKCFDKNINHRTFTSTRIADYTNKRFIRYYRCGPLDKNIPHEEHEWPVNELPVGTNLLYTEMEDDVKHKNKFSPAGYFGHPVIHVIESEESKPS